MVTEGNAIDQDRIIADLVALCGELDVAILGRQLKTGGDPILRWNIANIRVEPDAAGNIKFAKHKSVGKIDGAVGVAMAIGGALANEAGPTIYERARLPLGARLAGPAIVEQSDTTTVIPPGVTARVDDAGNLRLRRG